MGRRIERLITALVVLFFLLSVGALLYNVFFSKNSYRKIALYKESIRYMNSLIELKREENLRLRRQLEVLKEHPERQLEVFARDYLFMTDPQSWVILKNRTADR